MYKENIFEHIRREDIILFVGSGFSLYAGYPTANELKEIIFNKLTKPEKEDIGTHSNLADFSEDVKRIKGGNKGFLIDVLKNVFNDKEPINTDYHKKLSTISHIKTFITTNYDSLLEDHFKKSEYDLLTEDIHIPRKRKNRTEIFKIHGDLNNLKSLILTESDYIDFYKKQLNSIYWNTISERISSNNILFIGYSLEDNNIRYIFESITEKLKEFRKQVYFLAPNQKQHKINDLSRQGIHYIDSTSEEFIDELLDNFKKKCISDLKEGITSPETVREFARKNNLNIDYKTKENRYEIESINSSELTKKMNFQFNSNKEFQSFHSSMGQLFRGEKTDLNIDINQFKGFNLSMNDFEIYNKSQLKAIKIIYPVENTSINIFFENGFELTKIKTEIKKTPKIFYLDVILESGIIQTKFFRENLPKARFEFTYKHNKICSSLKDEIEYFKLIYYLSIGENYTIELFDEELKKPIPKLIGLADQAENFLKYFEGLKRIELKYKIRFKKIFFKEINEKLYNLVMLISSLIENNIAEINFEKEFVISLKKDYADETYQELKQLDSGIINNYMIPIGKEEILIHNMKINLGFKRIVLISPIIVNSRKFFNKKTHEIILKSKTNSALVYYNAEEDDFNLN